MSRAWLCVLLVGCLPDLQKENPPRAANKALPANFQQPGSQPVAASQPASFPVEHWKTFFASPELQALIDQALGRNQELNVRLQEIIVAQTEISARRGDLWPKLNAQVGAGIEKVGAYTSQGKSDAANGVPEHLGNFTFGLQASWEIDVWGKLRNAVKAADFRFQASIEAKNFIITQIVAEIARSYYELIALDNQLDILQRNIQIQQDALEVVKIEKAAARVTQLAVQRFEAEVLKNRSRLFDLQQQRVQVENRINFLVGRYPQSVARNPDQLMAQLPKVMQGGIPSALLDNRPDVREAERILEASELDVSVAKAMFLPSLNLDLGVGYESFDITKLVATPASIFYGIAGGITAPLLNRNVIEAQYRSANARQLQAVWSFERILLQAFTDVVNQLVKFENLQKSYDLRVQQVYTLAQAVEISNVLFRSARADYMEVLLTRRDSLDAQMELIETKLRLMQATVNIYQALGGGWRTEG